MARCFETKKNYYFPSAHSLTTFFFSLSLSLSPVLSYFRWCFSSKRILRVRPQNSWLSAVVNIFSSNFLHFAFFAKQSNRNNLCAGERSSDLNFPLKDLSKKLRFCILQKETELVPLRNTLCLWLLCLQLVKVHYWPTTTQRTISLSARKKQYYKLKCKLAKSIFVCEYGGQTCCQKVCVREGESELEKIWNLHTHRLLLLCSRGSAVAGKSKLCISQKRSK